MARPIRETPILVGEDAIRFMNAMESVDNMPEHQRNANKVALEKHYQKAIQRISVCIQ